MPSLNDITYYAAMIISVGFLLLALIAAIFINEGEKKARKRNLYTDSLKARSHFDRDVWERYERRRRAEARAGVYPIDHQGRKRVGLDK